MAFSSEMATPALMLRQGKGTIGVHVGARRGPRRCLSRGSERALSATERAHGVGVYIGVWKGHGPSALLSASAEMVRSAFVSGLGKIAVGPASAFMSRPGKGTAAFVSLLGKGAVGVRVRAGRPSAGGSSAGGNLDARVGPPADTIRTRG